MSNFEFSGFKRPPVKREYFPHESIKEGSGVQLALNLDLLTLEKMEEIDAQFDAMFAEISNTIENPVADELQVSQPAESQALVKVGSEVDEELVPVPVKKESYRSLSMFQLDKAIIRFRAQMLGGLPGEDDPDKRFIKDWNVVENGKKVQVCYETFLRMSKPQLDHLYNFVTEEASNPTKKKDKRSANT
jgi:hypothetical protein